MVSPHCTHLSWQQFSMCAFPRGQSMLLWPVLLSMFALPFSRQTADSPLFSAVEKAHEDVSMLVHISYFLIFLSLFVKQESTTSWG